MDKNATIGFVLITLLLLVYFYFFAPQPPTRSETPEKEVATNTDPLPTNDTATSPTIATTDTTVTDSAAIDSMHTAELKSQYGDFYELVEGKSQKIKVTTDELTVVINTKGGFIESAHLNHYKTYDSLPLPIISPNTNNAFGLLFGYGGTQIDSRDLYFEPSTDTDLSVTGSESRSVSLKAAVGPDKYIEQKYTFDAQSFDVEYEVVVKGMQDLFKNRFYEIYWDQYLPKTELAINNMRQKSTIVYNKGGDVSKLGITDDYKEEDLSIDVRWISYKSQFFSSILMGDQPFQSAQISMATPATDTINRIMKSDMYVEVGSMNNATSSYTFYLGPNEYSTLRSYDVGLHKEMDLGWWFIRYINVGTIYIFKFLEKYFNNYGIIIIILAVFVKILVSPFTYKSYISMAKMRVINETPEMKALDEKHKDDPQKLQMAKMSVYREMGASMFGGCLPMLLSYPFLIALFFFFPQSVELRQKSFLWANDLSTYDSILELPFTIPFYGDHVSLFTILMAISIMIYTYFNQKSQPTSAANQQMKYIQYFMPLIFLVFLNNYASGLSLYYFTSNILSIAQTTAIRYFIDDEQLLQKMRATQKARKKKGKKGNKPAKSRIERWMEQQQKKQQEMMRQRSQNQGGNSRSARRKK